MKYIFLFITILLSTSAFALPRADFATFWGGFNRILKFSHPKGDLKKIKLESLGKEINIFLSVEDRPSPLFVIYPGIFGEVDHKMVYHMAEELQKLGVHIIVLPNLASSSYLGVRKFAQSNPWTEEQRAQKEMFETAFKEINPALITSVNILAESLGVWQAIMMLEVLPRPINSLVLMWPPVNLASSLLRFDEQLKKSKATYDSCSFWWKWPSVLYHYRSDHLPENITNQEEECYGSYILQGSFLKGIKRVTNDAFKLRKVKLEVAPETFMGFANIVLKDLIPLLKDEEKVLHLATWVPILKKQNLHPIIYTSVDDFLNTESDWDLFKSDNYFKNNLTIYPWGGHSGRAAEPEFWNDLRSRLKNKI